VVQFCGTVELPQTEHNVLFADEPIENVKEVCISRPSGRNFFSNRRFPLLGSVGLPLISLTAAMGELIVPISTENVFPAKARIEVFVKSTTKPILFSWQLMRSLSFPRIRLPTVI
jgi:hypothetical protein